MAATLTSLGLGRASAAARHARPGDVSVVADANGGASRHSTRSLPRRVSISRNIQLYGGLGLVLTGPLSDERVKESPVSTSS